MTAMRAVAGVVVLGVATAASAQPSDDFEACKAHRRELTAQAMKIASAAQRGEALAAMPVCRRNADGSTEVVVREPAPVDDAPFSPRFHAALRTGFAANMVMSQNDFEPDGSGPFVELEAGYRWERAWSASLFGSFTRFSGLVPVFYTPPIPPSSIIVRDSLYAGGARVARHHFRWWFGGGVGYERDNNTNQGMAVPHDLGIVEEFVGYRLATASVVDAELMVLADEAFGDGREVISVRAGIGLRL
jgi:hypothetical protein